MHGENPERSSGRAALVCALCLAALAACSRSGSSQDEMSWARAALERNATLEVVASDPAAQLLTVRVRSTGELRTVRPSELIAALPPDLPAAGPAAAAGGPGISSVGPATPAVASPQPPPAAPSPGGDTGTASAAPGAPAATPAAHEAEGAAERQPVPPLPGGAVSRHVLASGPGYAIAAADAPVAAHADSQQAAGGAKGVPGRNVEVELRHEPIVCQGARMMRINNRNLSFDGNALSAEDGCELLITNSRIAANGIGVTARAASVHIENSLIEGVPSAIDASSGAQIYAQSSTFRGTIRNNDTAAFHDLGGNAGD